MKHPYLHTSSPRPPMPSLSGGAAQGASRESCAALRQRPSTKPASYTSVRPRAEGRTRRPDLHPCRGR
eukprot:365582-Chlamydomonas_euryale.AAC.12